VGAAGMPAPAVSQADPLNDPLGCLTQADPLNAPLQCLTQHNAGLVLRVAEEQI